MADVAQNQSNNTSNDHLDLLDFQIVFLTITIIATVFGNVLVLAAIYYDSRLRTVTNYFVACLALSDILVACFSMSIRLLTFFELRRYGGVGGALNLHVCRFLIWIDIFCEAASIYTLTVISVDRYFKISRPFQYREKITKTVAVVIIIAIWALAALLAGLGFVRFGDAEGVVLLPTTCNNNNKIFYTMAAVVAFFFPLLILILMYTLIFRIALYHFKKENAMTMVDPVSGKQLHYSAYKDLKATRTLFIVVNTFVICWGPFFVLFQIAQHQPTVLQKLGNKTHTVLVVVFFTLLPYANSFFNPVIYACFDRIYRRSFRKILLKMIGRSEYLANTKDYNSRNRQRNTSVFELTIAQPRESMISFTGRDPAGSPDEKERFHHGNSKKFHENGSASSPPGVLSDLGPDESDDMLVYHDK
jgi:hypothetical protein